MNISKVFLCWQFVKLFSGFSGVLLFNHTSSLLLFRFCAGYFSVSTTIVCALCFSSLWMFWCGFQRAMRSRGTRERQQLLHELQSIDTAKIPLIIDRFLELDSAGDQQPTAHVSSDVACYSTEKRCVVCLDAEACIQTLPCSHVVVCSRCAWQSLKIAYLQGSMHRCVVCRCEIQDFSGSLIKNLVNVNWKDVKKIVEEIKDI